MAKEYAFAWPINRQTVSREALTIYDTFSVGASVRYGICHANILILGPQKNLNKTPIPLMCLSLSCFWQPGRSLGLTNGCSWPPISLLDPTRFSSEAIVFGHKCEKLPKVISIEHTWTVLQRKGRQEEGLQEEKEGGSGLGG